MEAINKEDILGSELLAIQTVPMNRFSFLDHGLP